MGRVGTEVERLGFRTGVGHSGSIGNGPTPEGMKVIEGSDILQAVRLMTQPVC